MKYLIKLLIFLFFINYCFRFQKINFDLRWNPAIVNQRIGRIKRIGSPWDKVFISNLISRNSVDEKMLKAIKRKQGLFNRIIANTSSQDEAIKEFIDDNV